MQRRVLIAGTVAAAAGLAMAVAVWVGGSPASCAPACDCETIRSGLIAQPANAWTAAVIVAAGVWVAVRRPVPGILIALIGAAAFGAHATVAEWAYRAEGAVLAGSLWAVAVGAHQRGPAAGSAAGGIVGILAWFLPDPGAMVTAGIGVAVFLIGPATRRIGLRAGTSAVLLLGGGMAVRWLSDDGGPWCRPDAALTGHAVWHLAAAAGLMVVAGSLGRPTVPTSPEVVIPSIPPSRITEPSDDQKR